MEYLFYLVLFLALWHLLYEGTIAPTIRFLIRNKLFKLRDEIRDMYLFGDISQDDKKALHYLDEAVSVILKFQHTINISMVKSSIDRLNENHKLEKKSDARINFILKSDVPEIKNALKEIMKVVSDIMLVNGGGILPYMLLVFPYFILKERFEKFRALYQRLFTLPPHDTDKFINDFTVII